MPPKNPPKTNKKEEKKKQEMLKDRTFGMKNKKMRAQMEKNIIGGPSKQFPQKKKQEDDDLKDINKIFKPVVQSAQQNVSADVDPKSVLCVFFKQGLCTKGNKCKFSHDMAVQQKTAKKNLYVDSRELKGDENNDETNENWDEKMLQNVAEKKHGEKDRKRPNQTDIVCKYFLEAVEISKYGWFWECPNGDKCIYRHALPSGYILKKDKKKMEEQNRLSKITLEEFIETERAKLLTSKEQTKVTLETFIAWKKKKIREKRQAQREGDKNKLATFKSGKQAGLSGRDLFTFNPDLIAEQNDEEVGEETMVAQHEREPDEEEGVEPMHAFEIDDRTFQGLEFEDEEDGQQQQGNKVIVFDQGLFEGDEAEQLPSSSDDEEEEEEEEDERRRNGQGTSSSRSHAHQEEELAGKLDKNL